MAKTIDLLDKNPIAIIGMSSMFADADNIEKFWENILLGVDSIREVPDSRWSIDDYYDPDPNTPDKTYCKVGGFIPDVDFDPMEFGLPPNILEVTDASQLLALMVAKDALIDAGYAPGSEDLTADVKEKTGVILGVGGGQKLITPLTGRLQYPIWRRSLESIGLAEDKIEEALEKMRTAYIPWNENSFPGMLGNVISGRVANRFDLGGINCVVDAACAASLSAIKMAVGELLEGRCDMMITGGVDTDNSPFMYMSFSKTPAFSQKGSIRPFDHESDGMLIGEGVGMIVCKRLDDALRDGDRIYATIKGLGSSSDGRFKSVYAPRPQGQALAMKRAYAEAGFEASSVGLIEAHGTGTVAGDLSEGKSMKMVFGDNNPDMGHIALGSVKSQIGHTKAAAGVAGIVKAALALHHKVLPGTINVTRPKSDMDIETTPFYVNSETRPWFAKTSKTARRAGVSAFGFGGVNVHVALEEFSDEHTENYRVHSLHKLILVHAISAHDLTTELNNRLESLRGEGATTAFAALAKYSQEEAIPKINPRVGFVASNTAEAIKKFEIAIRMLGERLDAMAWEHPIEGIWYRASALNKQDKVVALFSGQGSQYVNMGNSLACAYPTLRTSFQKANDLFEARKEAPLTDKVYPVPVFNDDDREKQDEDLRQTQFAQPAIGALSVGMYKLFSHEGFRPDFFAGHSFGELTALWAAGAMDEDVYYRLAKSRGDAMALKGDGDTGSMLAVQGELADIESRISAYADVQIANVNSGTQIILGGATDSLKQLKDKLEHEGLAPKMLRVSAAFHTPFVAHAHQPFADAIAKAKFQGTNKPVYSNTTGKQYSNRAPKIKEALAKHMLSPVLFKEQVENMYGDGARVFIEFGPKSILTNLVKDILHDQEHITVAVNANPRKDSDRQLCEAAVQMAVMGMEVQGFDRFASPYHEKAEKGKMAVSISGYNYVSESTRKKHEDLIHEATETVHVFEKPVGQEAPVQEEIPIDRGSDQASAGVDDNAPEMKVINDKQESEMTKTELEILKKLQENLERLTDKQSKIEDILVRITSGALLDSGTPPAQPTVEPSAPKLAASSDVPSEAQAQEEVPVQEEAPANVDPAPMVTETQATPPEVSQPVTAAGGMDRSGIEASLLAVIAEKTGYPSEMLELSMDMEADLGIDSIKRVEIFGAMTTENPAIEGVNPQELAELRTLEQIVDYISGKAGASDNKDVHQAPATEPTPVPASETMVSEPAQTDMPIPATGGSEPASTSGGMDRAAIEASLLAIIAEKTGYPSEMLELNMDMEADLGIDSIKRVEIFGAMTADNPSIEGVNPQELAELRTLEQIVDYISGKAGASDNSDNKDVHQAPAAETTQAPAPATSVSEPTQTDTPTPVTEGSETASTSGGMDRAAIEASLLAIIAEKTGYPSEMLELSMDMEADLGIDSIKRVEIFGAMTADNPSIEGVNPQELAELRTLEQIVDYITNKASVSHPAQPSHEAEDASAGQETPIQLESTVQKPATNGVEAVAEPSEAAAPSTQGTDKSQIEASLLEVIAEKTGYPSEMLELTMDMEADLGIDSIKRVEIFGAMTAANPAIDGVNPQELAELRTLDQIVDYITSKAGGGGASNGQATPAETVEKKKSEPSIEPQTDGQIDTAATFESSYPNVRRSDVVLKFIPNPDRLEIAHEPGEITLITNEGTGLTSTLCSYLIESGLDVAVITFPNEIVRNSGMAFPAGVKEYVLSEISDDSIAKVVADVGGKVSQFIHLHPHFRFPMGQLGMQFDKEKDLTKATYLLAKHLKPSLNELAEKHRTAFMVVTRLDGAMGTENPGTVSIFGGGLFGLTKSLNQEWTKVYCRGVDLAPELKAEMASEKILAELNDADQCIVDTCYNADGNRHTLLAAKMPDVDSSKLNTKIQANDVFLVSGGGRGVTATCVVEMASAYKCKFIIVGRSALTDEEPGWAENVGETDELKRRAMEELKAAGEKPLPKTVMSMVGAVQADREIKGTLAGIRKNGGEAYYISADVTDTESLKSGVVEGVGQLGTITGIVHGAGRLADKLIENKTEADFDAVYDVKIKGLLAIVQAVDIAKIKRVVLFSSVAGFYGNTGQTDYAIANEILNRAAHLFKKNHPDIHTVSINWGAWDSGMVSPELKKIFDDYQVSLVPTDEGPKAMIDQLSQHYESQAQVILGSTLPMAKTHTDGPLTSHRVHRTLLESANPFLKHHVIQGNAVLPIINASTWMAQTAADLYPGFHLFKAEKVKLFKGIVFDGKQADDYVVTIKELTKNEEVVSVQVTISSENGATLPTNHYQAVISLASGRPEAPIMPLPDLSKIEVVQDDASGIYTDGTLFHGTDFQGVKKILQLDDDGVLLLCEHEGVSDQRQGQFPVKDLNVFLTDVMYQSLLIWIRKFYDSASLPLSTEKVEIFRVFPFGKPFYVHLQVLKSDEFGMQADITAFDAETGEVYMKSSEARVTLSRDLVWD